ncbi:toxin-activating lysine-acyltransferase [Intestinirhabdus alba]|uniref:RTX toxin-activating lysine-acyltransferase n=1 Tax=Intestinirhabdus alba TaxID=2899544 RepID=A0A6L6INN1_9ENTR|nr:toxin-activating lysine-acyltransferase [Intestinirhabdus alba]
MSFITESRHGKNKFSQYENLGFAVSCMLMNNNYSLYHIKTLQLWTQKAINHNQFKILFDHKENPLGYITWAWFRDDTLARLINDPLFLPHSSEWNEGGTLCILDFCCHPGSARLCMDYLKGVAPVIGSDRIVWRAKKSGKLMTMKKRQYSESGMKP